MRPEFSAMPSKLVGQRPIMGRDFAPSDETPGAALVVILSYGFGTALRKRSSNHRPDCTDQWRSGERDRK